jgi:hypothetical protein
MSEVVNAANCSVSAQADGGYLVFKTGGDPAAADASAVSATIAGDFVMRARALGDAFAYVGVSANPLAGVAPSSVERAYLINGSTARPCDAGVLRAPITTPGAAYLWIRRTGATLQYLVGAELGSATVLRTVGAGGAAMGFDSSIVRAAGGLEIRFDSAAAFAGRKRRRRLSIGFTF